MNEDFEAGDHEFDQVARVIYENGEYAGDAGPDIQEQYGQIVCFRCKSKIFEVLYTGDYQTSVRCVTCGHWMAVHNG